MQRYGYFEARVKLPTAPGLWPTFWLMPDRGAAAGPQWKRQDTGNGGMEFDIMEHLTRWGPYRYNIALHWDGYGKEHKAVGSATNYVQADKDGFITSGLLWTPGSAVFYCNGRELWRWEDPRVSNVPSRHHHRDHHRRLGQQRRRRRATAGRLPDRLRARLAAPGPGVGGRRQAAAGKKR